MSSSKHRLRVIVNESEQCSPLEGEFRFELFQTLLQNGFSVTDWHEDGTVADSDGTPLLVLGNYASRQLPETGSGNGTPVVFKDIQGLQTDDILQLVQQVSTDLEMEKPGAWKPWFPVIDYDLCTNCMQCLSFCLFDVYGVTGEGGIEVRNHNKCKTDCPACSRVCPEVAILFPKYRSGPINGDEVKSEDLEREKMKVDISSLLGGDIYKALRDRSEHAQSRFAKERDEEKALKERQRCLARLKQDLDIPAEVLMSLPSLTEIQQKANEARQTNRNGNNADPADHS